MTVPYSIDSSANHYSHYYSRQAGGGISIFRGKTVQHGSGLGGVFSKVFKGIAPILKQVAKSAGKQVLNTGTKVIKDVIDGVSLKDSATKNFSEGGKMLMKDSSSKFSLSKKGRVKLKHKPKYSKLTKTMKRHVTSDIFQ